MHRVTLLCECERRLYLRQVIWVSDETLKENSDSRQYLKWFPGAIYFITSTQFSLYCSLLFCHFEFNMRNSQDNLYFSQDLPMHPLILKSFNLFNKTFWCSIVSFMNILLSKDCFPSTNKPFSFSKRLASVLFGVLEYLLKSPCSF